MDLEELIKKYEKEQKVYRQFERTSAGDYQSRYYQGKSEAFSEAIDIIKASINQEEELEEVVIEE